MKGFRININDVSFKIFHNTFLDPLYTQDYRTIYKFSSNSLVVWCESFFLEGGGGCNGKDFYLILLIL